MFKIIRMEGSTAVDVTSRFYHELIGADPSIVAELSRSGDSLLFSKIPEGGSALAVLSRGHANVLFNLDKEHVATVTPLRRLSALAADGMPNVYIFILPTVLTLPKREVHNS